MRHRGLVPWGVFPHQAGDAGLRKHLDSTGATPRRIGGILHLHETPVGAAAETSLRQSGRGPSPTAGVRRWPRLGSAPRAKRWRRRNRSIPPSAGTPRSSRSLLRASKRLRRRNPPRAAADYDPAKIALARGTPGPMLSACLGAASAAVPLKLRNESLTNNLTVNLRCHRDAGFVRQWRLRRAARPDQASRRL